MALKKKASVRREKNVVRSYFDASVRDASVKPSGKAKAAAVEAIATTPERADAFLNENRVAFGLQNVELRRDIIKEGAATASVRYEQRHEGLPVYGSEVVIGLPKTGGEPTSAVNKVDYDIPASLTPQKMKVSSEQADGIVKDALRAYFSEVVTGPPRLFVYRIPPDKPEPHPHLGDAEFARMKSVLALGKGTPGSAYLAFRIEADTRDDGGLPRGQWEVMVDAISGGILTVNDRRRYAAPKAYVFYPDPITSSGNAALRWSTAVATLNQERKLVTLANLNPPVNGSYALSGTYVVSVDNEPPAFPPVRSNGSFKFEAKDREFLSVMAYYWIDKFVVYLRTFLIPTLNSAMTKPIRVDAQGLQGQDNSHFVVTAAGSHHIAFGEGGVPDASDPHVVIHEYGHAVHHFLGSNQNGYEEGFSDFMAVAWLDRFNTRKFQRSTVFPWDNNADVNYDAKRRLDLDERFDDSGFGSYPMYLKGDILATALFELFLDLGGSGTVTKRKQAADKVIRIYLEMLITTADGSPPEDLANGMLVADQALNQGANKAAIKKAFKSRGLVL